MTLLRARRIVEKGGGFAWASEFEDVRGVGEGVDDAARSAADCFVGG